MTATLIAIFGVKDHLGIAQECARAVLIFCYGLVMLRLTGRRTFGHWSALDIVISIVGEVALSALGAGAGTRLAVMVLFALLMGLDGASLRRWTLSRGKWRQIDVVVADDAQSAERRFFDRWTARRNLVNDQSAVERGAPPPTRHVPGEAFSRPPSGAHEAIIGLFPQPGASR